MTDLKNARLLDEILTPDDLNDRSRDELKQIADEVRQEVIDAVSVTGGHLGAGLGVVELTVALHSVFNTPTDRLIWDVGHQCYPHKILTERRDRIRTLRQGGGLSGFTKRAESEFDPFGAAHASTSISAAHGFATSRDLQGNDNHVVSVIGDGSMTAGMAYEAMNNVGGDQKRQVVILNDNDMSIAPPTGAMSHYLSRLVSSRSYLKLRDISKKLSEKKREALFVEIQEKALAYGIASATIEEIDEMNILHASMLAMSRAVSLLSIVPEHVLVDGNRIPLNLPCSAEAVVKGDARQAAISAASILAKVTRDRDIVKAAGIYPEYGFEKHKGYPTAQHLEAIRLHGITPIHRRSFGPVKKILEG